MQYKMQCGLKKILSTVDGMEGAMGYVHELNAMFFNNNRFDKLIMHCVLIDTYQRLLNMINKLNE